MQSLRKVVAHYQSGDLESAVIAALVASGKDPDHLAPEDLAPIDEFHVRGPIATRELAREVNPSPGMQVLDLGSGLGGASRYLAREFGCSVVGVDLCDSYCRVATMLSARLGLEQKVRYLTANALTLPFSSHSFDVVWTQHTQMNIPDKLRLYREIGRVLKPGGRLALYDILAGAGGEVRFPVPWASDPSASFLATQPELRHHLAQAGFQELSWRDVTREGVDWFHKRQEKSGREGARPLGLQLLLGPDFGRMAQNMRLNLEENRITLVQAVFQAPCRN